MILGGHRPHYHSKTVADTLHEVGICHGFTLKVWTVCPAALYDTRLTALLRDACVEPGLAEGFRIL